MATALPPPGGGGTPRLTIGVDLTPLQQARQATQTYAREIANAFKPIQVEQKLALEQARQTTIALRSEGQTRLVAARAEAQTRVQVARAAATQEIEVERRKTAAYKQELRDQAAAARQASAEKNAATRAGGQAALGRGLTSVAGALGIGLGAAGVVQAGREVIGATQLATAYARQESAALRLAGSQARLNSLLAAYEDATGGAVDRAQALADVTRLQAVGFARTAPELERFVRAARGAALAMGKSQEDITQEVQLAISNQSIRRLDQIGLGVTEVNDRIAELREQNSGLTREAAFQEAILGLLTEKYGELTRRAENQASGVERLSKAWHDFQLELGQDAKPSIDAAAAALANLLNWLQKVNAEMERRSQAKQLTWGGAEAATIALAQGRMAGDIGRHGAPGAAARNAAATAEEFTADQIQVQIDYNRQIADLERQASRARLDETERYEGQRTNIIGNYAKQTAREAEDFARQRLGQERKLNLAILDVAADSARQRAKWEADLARTIAEQRTDSAEKVAELRADANEKLAELDKDYYRDRERSAGDHRDKLLDAAARLDATAVFEEQRRYARERRDAEEAHKEQRADTTKDLDKRVAEEQASLDKSIRQAQEAHQRQLDEQAENDRLRIDELKASFEEQRRQEDEERAIRLGRQAQDHEDQLNELARQHSARLTQINEQAAEERAQYDEQFDDALANAGKKTEAWITEQEKLTDAAIRDLQRYWKAAGVVFADRPEPVRAGGGGSSGFGSALPSRASGGPIPRTGPVLLHSGEYVLNAPTTRALGGMMGGFDQASLLAAVRGGGRSVTWNGDVSVSIAGSTNMGAGEMYSVAKQAFYDTLEEIAQ